MPTLPQTPVIYQIRHLASGRVYVGSALNVRNRWKKHRSDLRLGKHHSIYLQRAWSKYGSDAFTFEIIELVARVEDLASREQYWIDILHASHNQYGYNIAPRARTNLDVRHTPESRAKVGAASRAHWADPEAHRAHAAAVVAAQRTPEARQYNREKAKAQRGTPEAKALTSKQTTERWRDPEYKQRKSAAIKAARSSPEAKAQQSEISKIMWSDPEHKARRIAAIKAGLNTPEAKAKLSAAHKAAWAKRKQDT